MPRAAETPAGTYVAKRIADYMNGKSNASRLDNIEVSCADQRPEGNAQKAYLAMEKRTVAARAPSDGVCSTVRLGSASDSRCPVRNGVRLLRPPHEPLKRRPSLSIHRSMTRAPSSSGTD